MYVSHESVEETDARLLGVIAGAEVVAFDGTFAFEELPLRDFPGRARGDALAFVRDDEVWSQLVPSSDAATELFALFRFHFPDGVDNSGFVGWLAAQLKRRLGTGVFVVCGQNHRRGGIFDYCGCPAHLGGAVRQVIDELRESGARR